MGSAFSNSVSHPSPSVKDTLYPRMDTRPHEARARIHLDERIDLYTWAGANLTSPSPGPSTRRSSDKRQIGQPTAADFYVPSLPGIPNLSAHPTHPLNLYAGHLDSYPGENQGGGDGDTGKDAAIFFMMARARRAAGKQRVIFWFNGGPGCSSFDGSLMEVGPFRMVAASQTESGKVEARLVEGGWEEFATIVFIDQPPGTGYSFIPTNGYLHELDQGSQHLIKFLDNFYHVFPELKSQDTYLAGESFAGQYIPYFASAIINSTSTNEINLKGIAIGNGWIDPKQQYPGYVDFAYEKGLIKKDTPEAAAMEASLARCTSEMEKYTDPFNTPVNINNCGGVMDSVSAPFTQELNGFKTCMNVYDVRLVDDWPACGMNWPPDLPDVYEFLRRPDVVTALHADKKETAWVECDGKVSAELHMKNSPAAVALLPHILDSGVKIMMFAGEEDLICNYKGIERSIANLNWGGAMGFSNTSTPQAWFLNDTQVGTWQEDRNMTFARVSASSHMVGFDVPHVTNDMILRFMDVDVSLVAGQAASSKSRVGDDERVYLGLISSLAGAGVPLLKGGNTDWESWYNAGSAILILLILCSIVGLYFYFRRRRPMHKRGVVGLPTDRERDDIEERVPLGADRMEMDNFEDRERRQRKGKGRERDDEERGETVFSLGDEDEDDDLKDRR